MFKKLKTSKKVSLYFSIYSFFSLIILLLWVNISYFWVWYSEQKLTSLYDMNMSYSSYSKDWMDNSNIENFKNYLLQKDVLIIPENKPAICSSSLTKKTKEDITKLQKKLFLTYEDKIYLIFSKKYEEIWEVKVFFDTTPYINSQIIIIKISLFIIFISVILNYFLWEIIVLKSLKNLEKIKNYSKNLDLENNFKKIKINAPLDDEILIVAEWINKALEKIKLQNDNLKQFISDVSHEFKTPLMAIWSKNDVFLAKIENDKFTKNDLFELYNYNKNYIKKLDKILEILLLITRLKEKNIPLNLKNTNLKSHINNLILEKNYSNFKIIWELNKNIDIYTFDLVFENLLNNAIKYWNNSEIIITLTKDFISIKDFWIWIKKEHLENLFQNFYKINPESQGFWVGLYIVKRLTEILNWEIIIDSKYWEYTEFKIKF